MARDATARREPARAPAHLASSRSPEGPARPADPSAHPSDGGARTPGGGRRSGDRGEFRAPEQGRARVVGKTAEPGEPRWRNFSAWRSAVGSGPPAGRRPAPFPVPVQGGQGAFGPGTRGEPKPPSPRHRITFRPDSDSHSRGISRVSAFAGGPGADPAPARGRGRGRIQAKVIQLSTRFFRPGHSGASGQPGSGRLGRRSTARPRGRGRSATGVRRASGLGRRPRSGCAGSPAPTANRPNVDHRGPRTEGAL